MHFDEISKGDPRARGLSRAMTGKGFKAQICRAGRVFYLGTYPELREAATAYNRAVVLTSSICSKVDLNPAGAQVPAEFELNRYEKKMLLALGLPANLTINKITPDKAAKALASVVSNTANAEIDQLLPFPNTVGMTAEESQRAQAEHRHSQIELLRSLSEERQKTKEKLRRLDQQIDALQAKVLAEFEVVNHAYLMSVVQHRAPTSPAPTVRLPTTVSDDPSVLSGQFRPDAAPEVGRRFKFNRANLERSFLNGEDAPEDPEDIDGEDAHDFPDLENSEPVPKDQEEEIPEADLGLG